jgi:hypothetical protein
MHPQAAGWPGLQMRAETLLCLTVADFCSLHPPMRGGIR